MSDHPPYPRLRPGPRPKRPSFAAVVAWKLRLRELTLPEICEHLARNPDTATTPTGMTWTPARVQAQLRQVQRWREHRARKGLDPDAGLGGDGSGERAA